MSKFAAGDRVQVTDSGLAQLRAIMRRSGIEPQPNHTGTVEDVWPDGQVLIVFDDGAGAPYPAAEVLPLEGDPIL